MKALIPLLFARGERRFEITATILPSHPVSMTGLKDFAFNMQNVQSVLSLTHHSIASSRPSPLVAEVLNMDHVRLFNAERPRALDTSDADMAPSIS